MSRTAPQPAQPAEKWFRTRVIGYLLSLLLSVINSTLRWKKIGLVENNLHWSEGAPVIMVFWHGDQLMMPWVYNPDTNINKKKDIFALISQHNDGRIAAKTLEHFSVKNIGGSSTSGAARALLQLKTKLMAGFHVALTPDGPKGPAHIAKQGPVVLGSRTGVPLLPIVVAAEKFWSLGSWDKMFIPKPFSRIVALAGPAYLVPNELSREELELESNRLTSCLNSLKAKAESLLLAA